MTKSLTWKNQAKIYTVGTVRIHQSIEQIRPLAVAYLLFSDIIEQTPLNNCQNNTMDLTRTPHLATVIYVINFSAPDRKIRFKQAEIEAAFAGFVNGQSQQTNIPDNADPAQPRIMFSDEKKTIIASQINFQLQMTFPSTGLTIENQLRIVNKNVIEFFDRAKKCLDANSFQNSGLVYDITFPSNASIASLHDYIFDRFLRVERIGEIASSQFNVGFLLDNLYLTVSGSVYESRRMDFPTGATTELIMVNLLTLPIIDYGLQFKVDLNDRPRHVSGPAPFTSPEDLLDAGEKFIRTKFEKFSGLKLGGEL